MRILHIVGDSKWGGGGSIILALTEMAQEAGWQVDVLATDPVCQKMFRSRGVGVVDLDVIWRNIRPLRDLRGLHKLYRFLKENPYDLVHTHTSKAGFVGRIAAFHAGIPAIVHTAHSFPFHEDSGAVSSLLWRALEQYAARCCHRIVTVSHYHRDWGLRWKIGGPEKIVAIPNGIPDVQQRICRHARQVRDELKISESETFFLTPGRLFQGKGLEYLIDAAALLRSRFPNRPFRVVLAGDGPLRAALERQVSRMGLAETVLFAGFRQDIPDLLNAADIVVLPSLHEGMSIALLEAMSAGKPVVATSIGGNLEPVANGEGALIVPVRNAAALADAMGALMSDPQLAGEKAQNALRLFRAGHIQQLMAGRYRALYQELLKVRVCEASPVWQ
ncbi:MAG TPA: glycosyltransferase family 4 protein [Bryobacteraceae bacterium]|nr:glycosyltransferase family 4 protein [Bryobacteraceae bacterium]